MSKTAKGLVEYARAQLGRPYWWGTFGQTADASLLAAKRKQYPGYYLAADFESQFGQKVHDCVGLIKGYRWCDGPEDGRPAYIGAQDVAVAGLYRQCGAKGDILSMPDEPGICVFMGNMGHVGVYIGGGRVIEAMGHAYGVVETRLSGRGWAFWGKPDWIDYGEGAPAAGNTSHTSVAGAGIRPSYFYRVALPLLKTGMVCGEVRTAQRLLIALRYLPAGEDDGEFGPKTFKAAQDFQRARGLLADGEIGGDTWSELAKG